MSIPARLATAWRPPGDSLATARPRPPSRRLSSIYFVAESLRLAEPGPLRRHKQVVIKRAWAELFGLLAMRIIRLPRLACRLRIGAPIQYAAAWTAAVGIGALTEYMQIETGRDAVAGR